MQVITKNITELIPAEYNPRRKLKPGDKEYEKLKKSIQEFGYVDPVIWNERTGHVVGGHQRLEVMQEMGAAEVMVSVVDLPEDKEKALNVALNKISGEWDQDKLVDLLHELGDMVELTGFDAEELDKLFDNKTDVQEDDFDADAALADITEPVTKRGDIWQLGRHRLMCGDSTMLDDVDRLMDGKKADMVFTDPPYGIDYSGGRTQVVNEKEYGKLKNDNLQGEALGSLICNVFKYSKAEADIYICVSPIMQKPFLDYINNQNRTIDAVIVWDKKQPGLGYMAYRRQCEFILFIKGKPFRKGDTSDFDLWSISRDDATTYVHGTQKPIALSARAIKNSSKKEDNVLDLFGGSGSTLIACEQLNRICYMMELDEKYCDVIIKRWEELTGQKAELISG